LNSSLQNHSKSLVINETGGRLEIFGLSSIKKYTFAENKDQHGRISAATRAEIQ
jgi:hypothetical protein